MEGWRGNAVARLAHVTWQNFWAIFFFKKSRAKHVTVKLWKERMFG